MTTAPFRPAAMARERSHDRWRAGLRLAATLMIASCVSAPGASRAPQAPPIGWKGNLHTHSLWSDGTDFPEMIVAWYRDHGYNFLSLTEHDLLQRDERWVDIEAEDAGWPPRNASARVALPGYRDRFSVNWVDERPLANGHLVRLRLLDEYRERFEEPGAFLLIEGEEITDREGTHVNAINLEVAIKPQGGETAMERIRNNVLAVNAQERRFRRPIAAIVNHPNWTWAWTAEDIAAVPEARIFEVYNGHLLINNGGDSLHVSTERIWDVALSLRHAAGHPPIYAAASDDAHDYREHGDSISRVGRGWIMVRTARLDPDSIVRALQDGRFYASTGVSIRSETYDEERMRIEIDAQPGVTYRTRFIGTRLGTPLDSEPVVDAQGDTVRTTRRYDEGVGEVLAEVEGVVAEYRYAGDERYVRAQVTSSQPHVDPTTGKVLGVQQAWLQPVFR